MNVKAAMRWMVLAGAGMAAVCCAAFGQVNPHTQIRWPAGCTAPNTVYSFATDSCIPAGGGGGGVTPSPQFSLFYQPNPGTVSAAVGDPSATTDGHGHAVVASLRAGGVPAGHTFTLNALATIPVDWTMDVTTALTALQSVLAGTAVTLDAAGNMKARSQSLTPIVHFGDSLTAGGQGVGPVGSPPYFEQKILGVPVLNMGYGGYTTKELAVIAGAVPTYTTGSIIIPACTDALACTPAPVTLSPAPVSFSGSTNTLYCSLGGIAGYYTNSGGYQWTPLQTTGGVTLPGNTQCIPTTSYSNSILLSGWGHNNVLTDGCAQVQSDFAALAAIATKGYLFGAILNDDVPNYWAGTANYNTTIACNTALQSTYYSATPANNHWVYDSVHGWDLREQLVQIGCAQPSWDIISASNCAHDTLPLFMKAHEGTVTLAADLAPGDTSAQLNLFTGSFTTEIPELLALDVGGSAEEIEITGACTSATGVSPFTCPIVRALGGSAVAHVTGTAGALYSPLHLSGDDKNQTTIPWLPTTFACNYASNQYCYSGGYYYDAQAWIASLTPILAVNPVTTQPDLQQGFRSQRPFGQHNFPNGLTSNADAFCFTRFTQFKTCLTQTTPYGDIQTGVSFSPTYTKPDGIGGTITYVSGGSATGTGTCNVAAVGGGGTSVATGTVPVSANVISGVLFISVHGAGYTSIPISWTLSNGTGATCSGTIVSSGGSFWGVQPSGLGMTAGVTPIPWNYVKANYFDLYTANGENFWFRFSPRFSTPLTQSQNIYLNNALSGTILLGEASGPTTQQFTTSMVRGTACVAPCDIGGLHNGFDDFYYAKSGDPTVTMQVTADNITAAHVQRWPNMSGIPMDLPATPAAGAIPYLTATNSDLSGTGQVAPNATAVPMYLTETSSVPAFTAAPSMIYAISSGASSIATPLASTTYLIASGGIGGVTTSANKPPLYAAKTCTATYFDCTIQVSGTLGTGGDAVTCGIWDLTAGAALTGVSVSVPVTAVTNFGTAETSSTAAVAQSHKLLLYFITPGSWSQQPTTVAAAGNMGCQ